MKAWQRSIREQKAQEVPYNLFGAWYESIDKTLSKAEVKPVGYETAKVIISEYEWLGKMPAVVLCCYGIFFEKNCGGVVVFSPEYGENLGWTDKYGYTDKIILLARGACLHWTPPNTASRLIRQAIRILPPGYEVVTATVDAKAGEIGTIYQACGFHHVGVMHEQDANRFGISIDGGSTIIGSRAMRHTIGNQRIEEVLKVYPEAVRVPQIVKSRYFCFRGKKEVQNKHYESIRHLIKPYPKRDQE